MKVVADRREQKLVLAALNENHNHDINNVIFSAYPEQKRFPRTGMGLSFSTRLSTFSLMQILLKMVAFLAV